MTSTAPTWTTLAAAPTGPVEDTLNVSVPSDTPDTHPATRTAVVGTVALLMVPLREPEPSVVMPSLSRHVPDADTPQLMGPGTSTALELLSVNSMGIVVVGGFSTPQTPATVAAWAGTIGTAVTMTAVAMPTTTQGMVRRHHDRRCLSPFERRSRRPFWVW